MADYIERVVDRELDELADELPAVSLEGPRAVGKTETALRRARTVFWLDDDAALTIARADPLRLARGEQPILIDEWQRLPASWDVVRRAVDADFAGSRFLLTGSAAPNELPTHSGAGRIVTIRMRPLSLAERLGTGTVSLSQLLDGARRSLDGFSDVTLADYANEIVRSGLPATRGLRERVIRGILDGYLDRIIEYDVVEQGTRIRDPQALRTWLSAYAAAVSTATTFTKITGGGDLTRGADTGSQHGTGISRSTRTCVDDRGHPCMAADVEPSQACGGSTRAPTGRPRLCCTAAGRRRRRAARWQLGQGGPSPRRHAVGRPVRIAGDVVGARLCTGQRGSGVPPANPRRRA